MTCLSADDPPAQRPYAFTVCALLLLALVLAAYPLVRLFAHYEIDYNEGWNAYFQLRAAAGQPLYSGYSPLFFNNYPPLSFYIVGALGKLLGDPVLAGRLVSMAAFGAVAASCGAIVRGAGGSRWDARLAVATCILLFAAFATDYLGLNDPQLLGMGFSLAGLWLYLRGPPAPWRAALSGALLAASVLTKHNLLVVPLLMTGDIIINAAPRARVAFLATAAATGLASLALLWALAGKAFFVQLLAPRSWDAARAFLFTSEILARYQASLIAVGLGLIAARSAPARLMLAYLVLALAFGGFFSGGAGTDINVFFDIIVALAIGAGLVARELRDRGGSARALAALALVINAGALFAAPLCLGRFAVDVTGEIAERESLFRADTAYLRALPGPALCESQLLCLRAGKPMFYDSFNADQAMLTGRLPADTLTGMLRRHEIAVVEVNSFRQNDPDGPPGVQAMPSRFVNFEDDVFDVLDREYTIDRVGISGRFYRPRVNRRPASPASSP